MKNLKTIGKALVLTSLVMTQANAFNWEGVKTKTNDAVDRAAKKTSEWCGKLEDTHWNDKVEYQEVTDLEERTERSKIITGDGDITGREIDYLERKVEVPVKKVVKVIHPGIKSNIVNSEAFKKAGEKFEQAAEKTSGWYSKLQKVRWKDTVEKNGWSADGQYFAERVTPGIKSKIIASKVFTKASDAVSKVAAKTSGWYSKLENIDWKAKGQKLLSSTNNVVDKVAKKTSGWYSKLENIQWKEKGKSFFARLKKKARKKVSPKVDVEQITEKVSTGGEVSSAAFDSAKKIIKDTLKDCAKREALQAASTGGDVPSVVSDSAEKTVEKVASGAKVVAGSFSGWVKKVLGSERFEKSEAWLKNNQKTLKIVSGVVAAGAVLAGTYWVVTTIKKARKKNQDEKKKEEES